MICIRPINNNQNNFYASRKNAVSFGNSIMTPKDAVQVFEDVIESCVYKRKVNINSLTTALRWVQRVIKESIGEAEESMDILIGENKKILPQRKVLDDSVEVFRHFEDASTEQYPVLKYEVNMPFIDTEGLRAYLSSNIFIKRQVPQIEERKPFFTSTTPVNPVVCILRPLPEGSHLEKASIIGNLSDRMATVKFKIPKKKPLEMATTQIDLNK